MDKRWMRSVVVVHGGGKHSRWRYEEQCVDVCLICIVNVLLRWVIELNNIDTGLESRNDGIGVCETKTINEASEGRIATR